MIRSTIHTEGAARRESSSVCGWKGEASWRRCCLSWVGTNWKGFLAPTGKGCTNDKAPGMFDYP